MFSPNLTSLSLQSLLVELALCGSIVRWSWVDRTVSDWGQMLVLRTVLRQKGSERGLRDRASLMGEDGGGATTGRLSDFDVAHFISNFMLC